MSIRPILSIPVWMSFHAMYSNTSIDNYCAEETFHQDMEKVVRRLKEAFVYGAEAEKIRHYIRENCRHSIIANL